MTDPSSERTDAVPVTEQLHGATQRLVRSVDALADDDWTQPSLLPGWSRAHVVAHLALNAEALAGALEGVRRAETVPLYASRVLRDNDIQQLAGQEPGRLRERLLGSTSVVAEAIATLPEDLAGTRLELVPGTQGFTAGAVAGMRWREVEVHHADLGAGYTAEDWSPAFVTFVLETTASRGGDLTAYAVDLDRTWTFGAGGPTVTGTGAALAWWLTGRGSGEGLTSEDGVLPGIEAL